jgi:hypothetical protein
MSDIIAPGINLGVSSFTHLDRNAAWFRDHLQQRGVNVGVGSPFDESLKAAESIARAHRDGQHPQMSGEEFREFFQTGLGVDYMVRAVHRALPNGLDAGGDVPWRSFRGPDVSLLRDAPQSQDRDRAWEILLAALVAPFSRGVEMAEPDVRCEFGSAKWGLAAKVLYTGNRNRHIDRIVEGARQVENSDVDVGVVAVNVTNLIEHEKYFPTMEDDNLGSFRDSSIPQRMLQEDVGRLVTEADGWSLVRRLTEDAEGVARLRTRAVIFLAQTVTAIHGAVSVLTVCDWFKFRALEVGEDLFLARLNDSGQRTLTHTF